MRIAVRISAALIAVALAIIVASAGCVAFVASGKAHDVGDAPNAPVAIVLGSQVRDGKPMRFLAGRLDAAIQLMADRVGRLRRL